MTLANNLHIQLNGQLQKINEGNDRAESERDSGSDVTKNDKDQGLREEYLEFEIKKKPQVQQDEIEINLIDDDDDGNYDDVDSDGDDDNDNGSREDQLNQDN